MRLTLLLVALFGLYICLSLAEESIIDDDASEPVDARNAIFGGKGKGKPKPSAGGQKPTQATSEATVKATVHSSRASKSASQVTKQSKATSVLLISSFFFLFSGIDQYGFDFKRNKHLISLRPSIWKRLSDIIHYLPSTTNAHYCTPTISKENLLKTTICICPDKIKASASKTPDPPCPYTTVPPLSTMLPMQNTDENSGGGFWSKAWEVAKPHAGHIAGQAGQFAVNRYGQRIKDKFNHVILVKGQDVSAADLAQVDLVQMEEAEESRAAQGGSEVEPSAYEGEQSGVGDGQAGAAEGGDSANSGSGVGGNDNVVDGAVAQENNQDAGRIGQQNSSPSRNAGQSGGASLQSGGVMDEGVDDSPNRVPGHKNPGIAAGNRAGNRGDQGERDAATHHSSPPVKLDQNYKLRDWSTDTHAISEDDITTSSNPLPDTTVAATSKSNTNGETSEPYAPSLTSNAALKSPTTPLPSSTSPIQVSTVTVTADPWVWTTTLGQNGDEEANGTVIAGEATVGMNIPIPDAPRCVTTGDARWAILSTPPPTPYVYVKAPVDSSAYIGNLTATALSSALYSVLSVACPEEECQPNATIPGIVYPGSHGDVKEGELVVTIHDGHLYTKDEGVRNLTFTLAAMLANASSTEMCFNGTVTAGSTYNNLPAVAGGVVILYVPLAEENILLRNMAGLMLIEYYSGNRTGGPDTRLFLSVSF
ncbi:hypothetical protein KC343_g1604 [Hortaea werneckii]|nr:hypothetical protein KC352_g6869 [Hortaea werneckii]KAI7570814.1 hypothetical protein KC317_g2153 [Hortaea werneckii]KAI7616340.1 hypothetical protein KC346_g6043 [Hortaea werneckii]KAI7635822.1 hypothetical protein KC343_g1604 [Hortaea werneckii]KAI7682222.1 hypothetical protein KC319_g1129 [Hortaea werneckii]